MGDMFNTPKHKAQTACKYRLLNALRYSDKRVFELEGFKGYVYVIQCRNFIKIGTTNNPQKRLSELQVGCPFKLNLLQSFASCAPKADEKRLHDLLHKRRVRGEWFRFTARMGELLQTFGVHL